METNINISQNRLEEKMKKKFGKLFDHNEIKLTNQIGKGAYGEVFLATIKNKTFVIKRLKKSVIHERAILNEVSILSYLSHFCNGIDGKILCFNDFMEDDSFFYIITEYLDKYILLSEYIISNKDNWKQEQIITVFENLKKGLITIHKAAVAHRDLKPDNIMIDPNTLDIKFIDFGLACQGKTCYTSEIVGTPLYHSPELLVNTAVGMQVLGSLGYKMFGDIPSNLTDWIYSDYWALGLVMIEFLTGQTLYDLINGIQVSTLQELISTLPKLKDDQTIIYGHIRSFCNQKFPGDNQIFKYCDSSIRLLLAPVRDGRHLMVKDTKSQHMTEVTLTLNLVGKN